MDKAKVKVKTAAEIAIEAAKHTAFVVVEKTKNGVKTVRDTVRHNGEKMKDVRK